MPRPTFVSSALDLTNEALLELIAAYKPAKVAIDAPFGWPAPFVSEIQSVARAPCQTALWSGPPIGRTTGDLVGYDTKTLKPRTSDQFNPDLIEFGWLEIESDKPVLPWGLTPWESGSAHGLMSLTWYRRQSLSDLAKDFSKAVRWR